MFFLSEKLLHGFSSVLETQICFPLCNKKQKSFPLIIVQTTYILYTLFLLKEFAPFNRNTCFLPYNLLVSLPLCISWKIQTSQALLNLYLGCSITVSRLILLPELDVRCMSSKVFCLILLYLNQFLVGISGKIYSIIIFRAKKIQDCISLQVRKKGQLVLYIYP